MFIYLNPNIFVLGCGECDMIEFIQYLTLNQVIIILIVDDKIHGLILSNIYLDYSLSFPCQDY